MFTIETAKAEDAWIAIIKQIMDHGDMIEDERDLITKEILNVIVTVHDPLNSELPQGHLSNEKLKRYEDAFLDIENHHDGINYGKRLREHFGFKMGRDIYKVKIDQVESVINRLNKCETSRRATMTTFDPSIDQCQNDIPSMVMIDFKIRKNMLFTTGIWRSQDIYSSWIPNFFGLEGLSTYVSEHVGIKQGPITIHSVSAHIYKTDFDNVKESTNNRNIL
ncbi:MAG: thymidylate synthase [Methanobacterium sp.]|uniref:thymidylate synthase n=1 Tax=Methanobacterium sp. TaxID=2164 RepID=UPI003C75F1F3